MITSFHNVYANFFAIFVGQALINGGTPNTHMTFTDYRGRSFNTAVRFGLPKAKDYTEEKREEYPCLIIESFTPDRRDDYYYPDSNNDYGNIRDTNNDGIDDKISLIPFPLPLDFRFEVTICSKDQTQHETMRQWFSANFSESKQEHFKFNVDPAETIQTFWGPDEICDLVAYKMQFLVDPVRSDGVYETIYQFNLYPYVQVFERVDFDIIQDLNLWVNQR